MSDGKSVALVTGANTGIGRVTAVELAKRGMHVVLGCRSAAKAEPVLDEIAAAGGKAELLELDLSRLSAVADAARRYRERDLGLDVLVNNAGLAGQAGLTEDGFELAFGVNHLGHFLFTLEVMPLLEAAGAKARVVNVSSNSHYRAKGIDWTAVKERTKHMTGMPEYEVSKLANVLFTKELVRRSTTGLQSYSLHPGVVASDVWRRVPWPFRSIIKLFMISNEEGAAPSVKCATESGLENGGYYDRGKLRRPNRVALDESLARELWERSEAWVAPHRDGKGDG